MHQSYGVIGKVAKRESSYLALPGQVVLVVSAAVQRDQEVGAGVSVGNGKTGVGHLLARGSCGEREQSAYILAVQLSVTVYRANARCRCLRVVGSSGCGRNWEVVAGRSRTG